MVPIYTFPASPSKSLDQKGHCLYIQVHLQHFRRACPIFSGVPQYLLSGSNTEGSGWLVGSVSQVDSRRTEGKIITYGYGLNCVPHPHPKFLC